MQSKRCRIRAGFCSDLLSIPRISPPSSRNSSFTWIISCSRVGFSVNTVFMVGMGRVDKEIFEPSSSSEPALTTSTSITETVNGSHEFKIRGYSLSKGTGIVKYIPSDTFMVGGYSWAIYFYPDGKSVEDNSTYVSLFIALASEGTDVRALFELALLDQSGR